MKKTLIMNSLMSQSRRVMDKTEFLAAIKLVSGEELLSMVTSVHDENGDYLIVENPIEVEEVMRQEKAKKRRLNYQDTSGKKLFGEKSRKKESVQLV